MPAELEWWRLIDKRAAVRENRPNLRRLLTERPGCAADNTRQAHYRAVTAERIARENQTRWEQAINENTRHREQLTQRAANAAYNAHRRTNQEEAA